MLCCGQSIRLGWKCCVPLIAQALITLCFDCRGNGKEIAKGEKSKDSRSRIHQIYTDHIEHALGKKFLKIYFLYS